MRDGKIVVGLYEASTSAAVRALAEGFLFTGYDVEIRNAYHFKVNEAEKYFDLVVVHGLRHKFREVRDYFVKLGIPVLVFDFGYIDRVNTGLDYNDKHWYLGLEDFGWFPDVDCAPDRFENLSSKIDYSRRKPNDKIYLCGQMPGDASHQMPDHQLANYYNSIFGELKKKSAGKYEILFRGHPRSPEFRPDRVIAAPPMLLEEMLDTAHAVVVHNSTIGLDALMRGCPVISYSESYYSNLVNGKDFDLDSLAVPAKEEVSKLCRKLSYAQWKLEECSRGEPLKFLSDNGYIPRAT